MLGYAVYYGYLEERWPDYNVCKYISYKLVKNLKIVFNPFSITSLFQKSKFGAHKANNYSQLLIYYYLEI